MAKSQDRGGKKEQRTPAKSDKKHKKGIPPHLQRERDVNNSAKGIQRHIDNLEERQK